MNPDDQLHLQLYSTTRRHTDEIEPEETRSRLAMALDDLEDLLAIEARHVGRTQPASPAPLVSPQPGPDSTVDRILDILDAGLQRPVGVGPGHSRVRAGDCTRCQKRRTRRPDEGLCPGCRAFLLGDIDQDPATGTHGSELEQ